MLLIRRIYNHVLYRPEGEELKRGWEQAAGVYSSLAGSYPGFGRLYYGSLVALFFFPPLTLVAIFHMVSLVEALRVSDMEIFCENVSLGSLVFIYQAGYLILFIRREPFEEMLRQVGAGFFSYKRPLTEKEKKCLENKLMELFLRLNFMGTLAAAIIYFMLTPIVRIYLTGTLSTQSDDPNEYAYNKNLPTRLGLPFNSHGLGVFLIEFVLVLIGVSYAAMIMLAIVNQFLGFNVQLWSQLRLLKASLGDIHERALYAMKVKGKNAIDGDLYDDNELQHCVMDCLRENIAHHTEIIRYFNKVQNLYSLWIFFFLISSGLCICLACYRFLTNDYSGDVKKIVINVLSQLMLVILLVTHSVILCLAGQRTTNLSEEVRGALYDIPWFKVDKRITATLVSMMANSKKGMVLTGLGIFPCNLDTLSGIMKSAYSFMNFVRTFASE